MRRKIYHWKLRTQELQLGERTLIMGVLNATPDSFSDGGQYTDPDRAYARALEMEEQGADIIDLGAESTRPGSRRITSDEEWQRLVPILKRLNGKLRIPLSLDTYKHETAERAMDYGVEIINDPSGLTFDAELARVVARADAGVVLNHMRGTPETWAKLPPIPDVAAVVTRELEAAASRARRALVEKNRIVIDPGFGFGKRKEQNAEILAHLGLLASVDYPILAGPSRKSFLGQEPGENTLMATAAAVTAAILRGAHIVRVHDVSEMRVVAQIADEVARHGDSAAAPEETESRSSKERRPTDRPRVQPVFGDAEKAKPARPPLAIRRLPPTEQSQTPPAAPEERRPDFRQQEPRREWKPRPAADSGFRPRRDDDRPRGREGSGQERPRGERPGGDRFRSDRLGAGRPRGDRPREETPRGDRPRGDRTQGNRTSGDRPPRARFDESSDRSPSRGPRRDGPPDSRPPRSGPRGDAPWKGKPPEGGRPRGGPPKRPFRKRP